MRSRLAAGALLGVSAGLGIAATERLARLGDAPVKPAPYYLAFLGVVALAALAGRLTAGGPESHSPAPPLEPGSRALRVVAGALAAWSFGATWILQAQPEPPLWAIPVWVLGLAALPFAFPRSGRIGPPAPGRRRLGLAAAIALLLAAGGAARLGYPGGVHPVWAGDESNVTNDALMVLSRAWRDDPFGMGTQNCAHLGMLAAGLGHRFLGDPIGGPRIPYGIAGTLSLAAVALAAAAVGGTYASLGALALILLAPQHVHWSRTADLVILDSVTVVVGVLCLLRARRTGSPRAACLAGLFAGLVFYGYTGGRILVVMAVAFVPVLAMAKALRGRRALVLAALLAGFVVAASPSLRYAVKHPREWNGRYDSTSVFARGWFAQETQRLGSAWRVLEQQTRMGTLGLLSSPPTIHYAGHPMIAPATLPALGLAGLGWLVGRRRWAESFLLALWLAGNLAVTALSISTPQPQRGSTLIAALAVLGGVAVAGFVRLFPGEARLGVRWRPAVAAAIVGVLVVTALPGYPLDVEPYAEGPGREAAFAQSASRLVGTPFGERQNLYLHGQPFLMWSFPSFRYFVPGLEAIEVSREARTRLGAAAFPPGLHLVPEGNIPQMGEWMRAAGVDRSVGLAHPAMPERDIGRAFVVPGESHPDCRLPGPPWVSAELVPSEAPAVRSSLTMEGKTLEVTHQTLDFGRIEDIFDSDPQTLGRTQGANPAVFEVVFPEPRVMRRVEVTTATMDICLKADLVLSNGQNRRFLRRYRLLPADPTVVLELPGLEALVARLRLEIGNPDGGDGHIHVRAIRFE